MHLFSMRFQRSTTVKLSTAWLTKKCRGQLALAATHFSMAFAALNMVECFAAMGTGALCQWLHADAVDAEVFDRVTAAIELFGAKEAAEQICIYLRKNRNERQTNKDKHKKMSMKFKLNIFNNKVDIRYPVNVFTGIPTREILTSRTPLFRTRYGLHKKRL